MLDTPTKDTLITAEEIAALRAEVRLLMDQEGLSQADAAREAGVAYGTFTPWMGDTYRGDNAGVAVRVRRWLETRRERARTAAVLPTAPGFIATKTAERLIGLLQFAQAAPDFAVIVGGAGIGKTCAITEYQRTNSNVHVLEAEPCHASPANMLLALAEQMGVVEKQWSRLSRAIAGRVRAAGALIVIDEAQHLSTPALDQLRAIHDKAGVGIAVVGNESVYSRLQGAERGAQFAQLYSRVGMRITQPRPRASDLCDLIKAWGVTGEKEIRLLKAIGSKPGALRGMTKTLRLASMQAAVRGEPLSAPHIRAAWAQLSASAIDETVQP